MKKTILFFAFILALSFTANAQEISSNAIGIRFGGGEGASGEVSYQKFLGSNNRLEINLGLANDVTDFKATALYQWVKRLDGNFNWYVGFGGGILSYDNIANDAELGIYGAGIIGIEYNFDAPILLSIDYRPEVGIAGGLDGLNSDVALSIRYQF